MYRLLTLFFILCWYHSSFSQTTAELEKQLQEATTAEEKMALNYKLGESYLQSNADKALKHGKAAFNSATDNGKKRMAGRSAFLVSKAYERKRDIRNTEVWLKSALKYAKESKDPDLIIKSVDKRSRLATKKRDYRKAYQVVEEAFTYFSKRDNNINDMDSQNEIERAQLKRDQAELDRQKQELNEEIEVLEDKIREMSAEKDRMSLNQQLLTHEKQKLLNEKNQVVEEITSKEEELASITEEKMKAEALAQKKEKEVEKLSEETAKAQLVLESTRADLAEAELQTERERNLRIYFYIGGAFLLIMALLFYSRLVSNRRAKNNLKEKNKIIEQERERSDELLRNILPAPIAEELKEFGKAKARKYDEVTVLFSDFKNFTKISEQLGPEELVNQLDKCFKAFDFIVSQYETIEKIKTIGDAYMCASGLTGRKTLPFEIIRAALEMQQFLEEQKQENIRLGKPYFEARIGIHTGAVVAGVVGVKKFGYDIWGDTVNIAARMEANGEVGRVNISENTYRLVKYQFDCHYRGKIQAKNKGAIDMYFVNKEISAVAV